MKRKILVGCVFALMVVVAGLLGAQRFEDIKGSYAVSLDTTYTAYSNTTPTYHPLAHAPNGLRYSKLAGYAYMTAITGADSIGDTDTLIAFLVANTGLIKDTLWGDTCVPPCTLSIKYDENEQYTELVDSAINGAGNVIWGTYTTGNDANNLGLLNDNLYLDVRYRDSAASANKILATETASATVYYWLRMIGE